MGWKTPLEKKVDKTGRGMEEWNFEEMSRKERKERDKRYREQQKGFARLLTWLTDSNAKLVVSTASVAFILAALVASPSIISGVKDYIRAGRTPDAAHIRNIQKKQGEGVILPQQTQEMIIAISEAKTFLQHAQTRQSPRERVESLALALRHLEETEKIGGEKLELTKQIEQIYQEAVEAEF